MGLVARSVAVLMSGAAMGMWMAGKPANAQDDGESSGTRSRQTTILQRLVIGAGEDKVAIDTPQAVTVLNQEDIDTEQPTTIGDVFDGVPGVQAIGSDRVFGESYNIRGIGSLSAADESKIIVNVDGVPKFYEQYRMGSFFSDPELYKRVEVLRGPASSTLYGSGALGGVINLTTKDASDYLEDGQKGSLKLKSSYDSNGTGVLGSTTLAVRMSENAEFLLSGNYRRSGDFTTGNGTVISGSNFDAFSGIAKTTFRFGDMNEQVLRVSYQRWQGKAIDQAYSQTGTLGFGNVDRDVTDQTAIVSYENPASDNPWVDLRISIAFSDTLNKQANATSPIPSPLFFDADYAYRTWSGKVENTIEHTGGNWENYLTMGLQASHQNRVAATAPGTPLSFHPEGTETKLGFYVQDEFILNDALTLIPGARVDWIRTNPSAAITGAAATQDVAFSPKLAALYRFNDHFSIFGSVAHTQRVPTMDELFSTNAPDTNYPGGRGPSLGLQKERSNNYEIGFAVSGYDVLTPGDSIQLKTTGFYNRLNNLITVNPNRGSAALVPYYVNIDQARIYGIEIEGAYEADYWFARAAYSAIAGQDLLTGAPLNSIPAHTLALTLGGRLPQYGLEAGWRALFASAAPAGTAGPTPAYNVHDVYLSWRPEDGAFDGWEAQASVENLFNTQYQNNLAGDPGKGRSFKLTLAKAIGWN
jgi:hemoglobin/transferrin/lactoferrin receptor protein